jgi:hypothetical protein
LPRGNTLPDPLPDQVERLGWRLHDDSERSDPMTLRPPRLPWEQQPVPAP